MALLNQADLGEHDAAFAHNGSEPAVATMPAIVRRFTPSVCDILSRANNPFMTGQRGFEAIGISRDQVENCIDPVLANPEYKEESDEPATIPNPKFKPELMMRLNPCIAEAMVLITCPMETLREIFQDTSLKKLSDAKFDFMESGNRGPLDIAMMIPFIAERQAAVASANFVIPQDDRPNDSDPNIAKKKPNRRGSRRM